MWWTTAKRRRRRRRAVRGRSTRRRSSRPGARSAAGRGRRRGHGRRGGRSGGARTVGGGDRAVEEERAQPRDRPATRYWIQRAAPVHHGFPMLPAARSRRARRCPRSGASSSSGCAGRQAPNRPGRSAVRNQTRPGPCQWTPTMLKRSGAARERRRPRGASGTSRATTRTSCAAAVPGAVTASAATSMSGRQERFMGGVRLFDRIRGLLRPQGHRHDPDRIFTLESAALAGTFLHRRAHRGSARARPEAQLPRRRRRASSRSSVENDINPVTQEYLIDAIERGERRGLRRGRASSWTRRAGSTRRCARSSRRSSTPTSRSSSTSTARLAGRFGGRFIALAADVAAMAPGDEHRLLDAGRGRRRGDPRGSPAQGRQRRRRVRARARRDARPQRRLGGGGGPLGVQPRRPGGARARTSSTWSRPTCRRS